MQNARSASQGTAPKAPPSIEDVRRRARHRLIGAAVLVLLGVVGFSLLFDSQPRPLPVDIPIVIPSKNAPAPAAASAAGAKPAAPGKSAPASAVAAGDSLAPSEEMVKSDPAASKPGDQPAGNSVEKPAHKPTGEVGEKPTAQTAPAQTPRPEPKVAAKTAPQPSESDRASALLNGQTAAKTADKPASALRLVVQVGAFADVTRAREVRMKLERAGLKTYTNVAETSQGKRIRVRVGPFATQAEADKAAARVKALGLPAAILTL